MDELDFFNANNDNALNTFCNTLQNRLGNNFVVNIVNGGNIINGFQEFPRITIHHSVHDNISSAVGIDHNRNIVGAGATFSIYNNNAINNIIHFVQQDMMDFINNSMSQHWINNHQVEITQIINMAPNFNMNNLQNQNEQAY